MGDKDGKKEEKRDGSIVLGMHCNCEGCKPKIIKAARSISGVDRARADWEANKLTVKATLDPSKLLEELEKRTKMKFELISPQAKKKEKESNNNNAEKKSEEKKAENNSDEKKADKKSDEKKAEKKSDENKAEKKSDENKAEKKSDEKKSKEPPETTAVLKLQLHCTGCIVKIYKRALKFKGVDKVKIDKDKDLVTVNGTMDVKALVQSLSKKMKRPVEIVPPKKDNSEGKEGGNGGGGGGGKKKGGGGNGAVEVIGENQLEYMGYPPGYPPVPAPVYGLDYAYPYAPGPPCGYPFFNYPHPPQSFSDQNPYACPCAIM